MRALWVILLALLVYLGGYAGFRAANTEVWAQDGRASVIYPSEAGPLYILFRPLAYADEAVTGTGSHIGPHGKVD